MIRVVKFTADWCNSCAPLDRIFDILSEKYAEKAQFWSLDVDQNGEAVLEKQINTIPTVIFERDGVEMLRIKGLQPISIYENILKNI
jgi:thioredoxin 1